MFTLGIPLKQKRRTLGYLSNEYFPGGMKKLGQQVPYEILSSDEGFFELGFPNMDEDEFRSITFQLKQQGVTVIGADSQLTEKTMKLVNLVPLKENKGTQVTDYMWRRMSDDEKIDALYSVVKDPDEAQRYFELDWEELPSGFERDMRIYGGYRNYEEGSKVDETQLEKEKFTTPDQMRMYKNEGSCGYAPEGEDPNEAEQPAGSHLLRKKIREMIESYVDDPDVPGTSGMEDAVNDPNAKAEKILMQLAKVFPDVPLSKIVNDSSYKRQAVTQILFGMMS
mgnify:CR=1 FL=1